MSLWFVVGVVRMDRKIAVASNEVVFDLQWRWYGELIIEGVLCRKF